VSLTGRADTDLTDDNGNFRIELRPPLPAGEIRVQSGKKDAVLLTKDYGRAKKAK
jgi:hypothetical protein